MAIARVLRHIELRVGGNPIPAGDNPAGAYENYTAGQRLEAAEQPDEAANSYRAAIVAGAPSGLSVVRIEHLKALSHASEKKS